MKLFLSALLAGVTFLTLNAESRLQLHSAKFTVGDDIAWKYKSIDDSSWKEVSIEKNLWEQGISFPQSYAWYRIHFTPTEEIRQRAELSQALLLHLGMIDDTDEVYVNGLFTGKTGKLPCDGGDVASTWDTNREYVFEHLDQINWGGDNVIAIRVWNIGDPGGMFGDISISAPELHEGLVCTWGESNNGKQQQCTLSLTNNFSPTQKGTIVIETTDAETGEKLSTFQKKITLKGHAKTQLATSYDFRRHTKVTLKYTDAKTGDSHVDTYYPKYLQTPEAPLSPRYNGPVVYGARPTSPVIFRIPVSGARPMKFEVKNLPAGLSLDDEKGVLSGSIEEAGNYAMTFVATNEYGSMSQEFTLKVGDVIGLTPAMGWNSWNCWGLSVSQEKVMQSAQSLLDKGLADYGYSYINVDDAWEADERNADGTIATNDRFPDMKALGDWLHEQGLKFGIYSSPGDRTCGLYLGSLGHEKQDAETYNSWGVDYLKYDWCGYSKVWDGLKDQTTASYVRPYLLMEEHLRNQPRDIWYSLCQYGMGDVWTWGHAVNANSWRTTGDITDSWQSVCECAFIPGVDIYPYAGPGHWNDPDMLVVGKVGWSDELRDTRLTPDEQYSHFSLWALQASVLLIGCPLDQLDDFTINLLCNNEVIAVNQDVLGKQAHRAANVDGIQVWMKQMADGSYAVGVFNMNEEEKDINLSDYYDACGIKSLKSLRDLWQQTDLKVSDTKYKLVPHACKLFRITLN